MRFLVQADVHPDADSAPLLSAELERVRELLADGTAECNYIAADGSRAYLVLNAADLDAARAVMHTLPMARAGMLDFTFTELLPSD
jgi:hypothetical protein